MAIQLPFSQACENNKDPILEVLKNHLTGDELVLEIASGTGQHAQYFCQHFPQLLWQATELPENLDGLNNRINSAKLANLIAAICLDVTQQHWPSIKPGAIFSANSLHIMPETSMTHFFAGIGRVLVKQGMVFVYGPFKYHGEFTSESNSRFDQWLKQQHSKSGIRDFETVCQLASTAGLELVQDYSMPANNQLLVFRRL